MKPAPLVIALLTALLALTACQNRGENAQTNTETNQTDTAQTDTTQTDEAPTNTEANETSSENADASTAVTQPGAIPSGYTQVPFLSEQPVREFKAEPALRLESGKDYYALIDTSRGQILADLYEQETPVTVNNFVTLARNHFFDGIRFHRVIEGFMAQTGDPGSVDESKKAEWGTGGPGYQFPDEFRTRLTFNSEGILAMANSGPATNGSQFFITFAPTDNLNGRHTIFGKVVTGGDVLPKLTRTANPDPTTGQEVPVEGATPDQILTVRILTKG